MAGLYPTFPLPKQGTTCVGAASGETYEVEQADSATDRPARRRRLVHGRGSSETIRFRACIGLKSAFPGVPTKVGVPSNGSATSAVVH